MSATLKQDGDLRTIAAWEIVSIVSTALLTEWAILSVGGGNRWLLVFPFAVAFAYIFVSQRAWRETARDLGWRRDNFLEALRLLALPMLLVSVVFIIYGYLNGQLDFSKWLKGRTILGLPVFGLLWGLVQQYVLQGFINRRAQVIWGKGWRSILLVAVLFGVLHLPNPALTAATFLGGLIWAAVYQRAPNLYALALSHAFMTWVLISTLSPQTLHGLRVGYKFFG